MNTQFKILLYICFVVGILYFVQQKYNIFDISFNSWEKKEQVKEEDSKVEIINAENIPIFVDVEIADTNELRNLGLSGRAEIGDYQGMLFIMDMENIHFFWMKDMNFNLDLIFIDSNGYIVDIFEDQTPCKEGYCPNISSPYPSKYILEVNGGFSKLNRVEVGNQVIFNISSEE